MYENKKLAALKAGVVSKSADALISVISSEKGSTIEDVALSFLSRIVSVIATIDIRRQVPIELKGAVKRNDQYIPFEKQVVSAIESFKKEGGKITVDESFRNRKSLQSILGKKVNRKILKEISSFFRYRFEEADKEKINQSDNRFSLKLLKAKTVKDILVISINDMIAFKKDSYQFELCMEIIQSLTKQDGSEISAAYDTYILDEGKFRKSDFFIQMKNGIEESVEQTGIKYTFEKLLIKALYFFDGNIQKAAQNLSLFLKIISRNYQFDLDYDVDGEAAMLEKSADWIQKHLEDTFNPLFSFNEVQSFDTESASAAVQVYPEQLEQIRRKPFIYERLAKLFTGEDYSDFDTRFHRVNLVGMPYRAAHLLYLSTLFGTDLLTLFIGGEYMRFGQDQGPVKLFADVLQLQEIRKIEKYIEEQIK